MVFQVHFSISCQVTHPIPYWPRDPFGHNWHLFLEGCEQLFRCDNASSHSAEKSLHERGANQRSATSSTSCASGYLTFVAEPGRSWLPLACWPGLYILDSYEAFYFFLGNLDILAFVNFILELQDFDNIYLVTQTPTTLLRMTSNKSSN